MSKSNQLYLTRRLSDNSNKKGQATSVRKLDLKCDDIPDEEMLLHQRIHKAYTLLGTFRPGYKQKVKVKRLFKIPHDEYSRIRMLSSNSGSAKSTSSCEGCSSSDCDSNREINDAIKEIEDEYITSTISGSSKHPNSRKSKLPDFVLESMLLTLSRVLIFLLLCLCLTYTFDFRADNKYHVKKPYTKQDKIRSDPEHNCSINLSQERLQTIPLLSFPGSGNTWLRHLIEEISGTFTGSVYNDHRLYDQGFSGEYEDPLSGKVIVVKSHLGNGVNAKEVWPPSEELFEYGVQEGGLKCIYLLRHPVDTYFSTRAFQATKSHTGYLEYPDFHSMVGRRSWRDTVNHWSAYYYDTYTKLEQSCSKGIKLVFYEDLVKNPWRLSKNLVTWIEQVNDDASNRTRKKRSTLEMERNSRKNCYKMNNEGDFHRNHMPSKHEHSFPGDLFSKKEMLEFDVMMDKLNRTMNGRLPYSYSFYKKR